MVPTSAPLGASSTGSWWGRWSLVLPIVVYGILGLAAYYPTWPGDPGRLPQCTCADAGLNTWFLAATAHALAHGHSLFFTSVLNHPYGVNLTYNAQMPLLGLVAAPLTWSAGPISSLNVLMWLAFPLSATSMFLVLRHWTDWTPAAFAGGLFYGFSPYIVGQSTAHLHLTFIPIPPLILLAVHELFVRRTGDPRRWGVALGLLVAGQFFISSEVLVTTGLVACIGLVILAAARPGQVLPSLRFATVGLLAALTVVAIAVAYPVWVFLTGPLHYRASSVTGGGLLLRADLLGPVVPTSLERFSPARWAASGDNLTVFGTYSENGSYLGAPLLILLALVVIRGWRNRWIRFSLTMVVATFLLSLGSPLSIDGHSTGIPLPDALLEHVPLVNALIPSRIAMLTTLFVSVILALGIDGLRRSSHSRETTGAGGPDTAVGGPVRRLRPVGWAGSAPRVAVVVVAILAVVALVPRWPNRTVPTNLPSYFTSTMVTSIPPGTVALTYPYAAPLHAQPMVWQAVTGFRFSLIGGYALVPDAHHVPTLFPSSLQPLSVQRFLINEEGGVPFHDSAPVADDARLVTAFRQFILRYDVGVILVDSTERNAVTVGRLVDRALGRRPVVGGGIDAWYDVSRSPQLRDPLAAARP